MVYKEGEHEVVAATANNNNNNAASSSSPSAVGTVGTNSTAAVTTTATAATQETGVDPNLDRPDREDDLKRLKVRDLIRVFSTRIFFSSSFPFVFLSPFPHDEMLFDKRLMVR